ncbi:MAG TPA: 50S ribosomal protein L25 [Clostridiales bacterium]|nr:50S ribosomal protein L25 [Clostridiales bacterium]
MNTELLQVTQRVPQTKAKKLRRQGYVPGVLYGPNNTTVPVIFDKKSVENFVQRKGEGAVFDVSLNGEIHPVKILEVQRDPVSREIIHLDLINIETEKKIHARVPLRFEGKDIVEKRGYILQHQKDTVVVEGLAKNIPPYILVPLHKLQKANNIRVQDLEISEEISILDAPNELIAASLKPTMRAEAEEEDAAKLPVPERESEKNDTADGE